jgi:hypothetical protein
MIHPELIDYCTKIIPVRVTMTEASFGHRSIACQNSSSLGNPISNRKKREITVNGMKKKTVRVQNNRHLKMGGSYD